MISISDGCTGTGSEIGTCILSGRETISLIFCLLQTMYSKVQPPTNWLNLVCCGSFHACITWLYQNHSNYQPYYSASSNQASTMTPHFTFPNNQTLVIQARPLFPNNQPISLGNNWRSRWSCKSWIITQAYSTPTTGSCSNHFHGTTISPLVWCQR